MGDADDYDSRGSTDECIGAASGREQNFHGKINEGGCADYVDIRADGDVAIMQPKLASSLCIQGTWQSTTRTSIKCKHMVCSRTHAHE